MLSINIFTHQNNAKDARKNKILVTTTYSQDGRSRESYWLSYNPDDQFALFLFETTVNSSTKVDSYSVYDSNGERNKNFIHEQNPKRI